MKKTEAIALFGTPSALAEALGINPASVSQWGEEIPRLRAYQIKELIANASEQEGSTSAA